MQIEIGSDSNQPLILLNEERAEEPLPLTAHPHKSPVRLEQPDSALENPDIFSATLPQGGLLKP
jgi:hypothetical protein